MAKAKDKDKDAPVDPRTNEPLGSSPPVTDEVDPDPKKQAAKVAKDDAKAAKDGPKESPPTGPGADPGKPYHVGHIGNPAGSALLFRGVGLGENNVVDLTDPANLQAIADWANKAGADLITPGDRSRTR